MYHPDRPLRLRRLAGAVGVAALAACLAIPGCKNEKPAANKETIVRYKDLGDKTGVPEVLKGTVYELTERTNDEPFRTATYGLVGRLRGTGDSTVSLPVRQWMIKQMTQHGYGSKLQPGYETIGAEQILRDPGYAIVRVDGSIPPGARERDTFDVSVTALPGNKTTSLSGGLLFESNLNPLRTSAPDLTGIQILARARGPIVINPAYALQDGTAASGQAKASLRSGTIMGGGIVTNDRPILLRLRHPQRNVARAIEQRINQRFQHVADHPRKDVMPTQYNVAQALDEGLVEVYVPKSYKGDWEHFMGVVEMLYTSPNPAHLLAKTKALVDEAVKPDAPLMEISYALEGIGEPALQYALPLMAHPNPNVAYAMARASVFIGDGSGAAEAALLRIGRNDAHPFQLAAIQTLGALPVSPARNQQLRDLLASKNTLARTEVYRVLSRGRDGAGGVYTRWIKDPRDRRPEEQREEKFALDIVQSGGQPLVYASRSGIPRLALIGPTPRLNTPVMFTTMDKRLMITSDANGKGVTIFFRDDGRKEPVKMRSRPDLAEIIARLGGEGAPEEERFDFSYGEIVAIVQQLAQQKKVLGVTPHQQVAVATFVYEQPSQTRESVETAPVIDGGEGRPNTAAESPPAAAKEQATAAPAAGNGAKAVAAN